MSDDTAVLSARDVMKRYGELQAVKGVSFEVRPGECYGLLGPNGAGKTTLFKMITGMARRSGGALTVFGLDPEAAPSEIKARLGVVGQEDNLDPDLDVHQNLETYGRYFGLGGPALHARCEKLLALLELTEKRDVRIMALSGGMKRRLMIVRALLNEPELLLLDEPTTGLDPQIRHAIWNSVRMLKQEGLTILLTTHYMEEAAQLADRVGIVNAGRMIAEGSPADLVAEHLPRYVLELAASDQDDESWRELAAEPGTRLVQHGDRVHVLHDDERHLRRLPHEWGLHGAHVRITSLEDVFLELTGRTLRD